MRAITTVVITFALLTSAVADKGEYIDKKVAYMSSKQTFKLVISPSKIDALGNCKAELYDVRSFIKRRIWSRFLINDLRPKVVWVSNNGNAIVTLDDYYIQGKLPVVVYGKNGRLLKSHSLESLGLYKEENIDHLERTVEFGTIWSDNAIVFGHPQHDVVYIALAWGEVLMIRLLDGAIMDGKWLAINLKMRTISRSHYDKLVQYGQEEFIRRKKVAKGKKKSSETQSHPIVYPPPTNLP